MRATDSGDSREEVAVNMLHRADTPLLKALRPAVHMLARAHQYRDPYTCLHQDRVADVSVSIGAILGLAPSRLEILHLAAMVHDIGKLGVPAEIVGKPGKLSDPEFALVQTHCAIGHDILVQLNAPFPIAEIVHQHHERRDGSGYPRGLKGSAILREASILAVADVFDAMSSYRPYRAALSEDFVLGELQQMAGHALDRDAVNACVYHVMSGKAVHPAVASLVEAAAGQES
jgi:HD-GYP domain-containing protein (c-di-GMP phosphodiesterase class II)